MKYFLDIKTQQTILLNLLFVANIYFIIASILDMINGSNTFGVNMIYFIFGCGIYFFGLFIKD